MRNSEYKDAVSASLVSYEKKTASIYSLLRSKKEAEQKNTISIKNFLNKGEVKKHE